MSINRKIFFLNVFLLVFLFSCKEKKEDDTWQDSITSGVIPIACDECFRPIMESEILVFESIYKAAGIVPTYTDEIKALDLLSKDSVRMVVVTRTLTDAEKADYLSRQRVVRELKIAEDAIALIVNKNNPDSIIGMPAFKKILTGQITDWKQLNPESTLGKIELMFDHRNSSTVRFAIDSVCRGEPLSGNLFAQGSHQAVVDMVAKSPNSIGVIGVNWVSNENDSTNLSFLDQVKVMAVSRYENADKNNSYQPFQAYIALGNYPMTRAVYILLSDPKSGLSSGFATFISTDRGQRIILKSGLVPATQPVNLVHIRDEALGN